MLRTIRITSWQQYSGLTLIELVITLTIASILALFIAPSFVGVIRDSRLTIQINQLVSALHIARSEAINRSISTVVCSSTDSTTCSISSGGVFEPGWLVFVDENEDGKVNGSDMIIRVYPALTGGNELRFNNGYKVTYGPTGIGKTAGTFVLCDDRGALSARAVVVNPVGRTRLAIDSDDDGIVNGGNVNNVSC